MNRSIAVSGAAIPRLTTRPSGLVANKLCRIVWKILHDGVAYVEYGNRPSLRNVQHRARRLARELRALGYTVQLPSLTQRFA